MLFPAQWPVRKGTMTDAVIAFVSWSTTYLFVRRLLNPETVNYFLILRTVPFLFPQSDLGHVMSDARGHRSVFGGCLLRRIGCGGRQRFQKRIVRVSLFTLTLVLLSPSTSTI